MLEDRVFDEVKRLCYAGLEDDVLLREVAARLRRVVPFDAYCASKTDPLSAMITRSVHENLGGARIVSLFFRHLYFEDDVGGYNWLPASERPVERPVRLLSEATGGRLERSMRYRELLRPAGLTYELRAFSAVGREFWGNLNLARERGRPDFDAREVSLVRRVAPHLGTGLRASTLRVRAAEADHGDAPGIVVLDDRGLVTHHTAAAERMLRDLGELGPGWREDGGLPAPVCMVLGALGRSLSPRSERDRSTVPRLCVRGRSGRWLTLQAVRGEPQSDGGVTMVVIEPAGVGEVAWIRASAYGLTRREREVVDLVVQGVSTKGISRRLYISEYTVQNHLSSVFEKVGVRGRRALVKRLFFEGLCPSFFG
ncbi:helix-turn-helix transcriptional regulator [Rubrobacter xylanophilus]|uniref:helix-turn-helix transcriptional regulator n=1 Tax=Rubrobacter xylanophilus TaxID=49319 RepID=UPI002D7E7B44|nr:helix-turn-helix transcriptional regulator [Rubrobacter xylanophilus]